MATVSLEEQSSVVEGTYDSLVASVSGFAVLPIDESGDGTSRHNMFPSSLSILDKGSDGIINEKDNMSEKMKPSTAERTTDQHEASVHVETTVEVCVKMVVCRKYITNTVDSKTGKVLSSTVKSEEDPPTIQNVHTYKSFTDTSQLPSAISPVKIQPSTMNSASVPTTTVKRRPGRPRKCPPSLVSSPQLRTTEKWSDSTKKDTSSVETQAEETSMETEISPETEAVGDAVKTNMKAERKSHHQTSADVSPNKETQNKAVAPLRVKQRRGRPSRVIKKPRKYLDSYDEGFLKSEFTEPPENDNEENSEEQEEGIEVEGKYKEEGGGEEKQGEEESAELMGETTEGAEESSGEQRMECPKCGKRFSNVSNCHRHINKDQCSRQLHCAFCDKLFDTRALLESHMESHRDQESQNSFRCGDCNRAYATRNGFLKHKRQGTCYKRDVFHEDGTQGEFECSKCRVRFTTEKLLDLHVEKVHENPNNEYKCPDCNRVFYSKLGFNKHVAKKSCTQPHECKVCGKKYSNKAKESFKSHMRYHLAETSGVQFQCEDCGRVYMTDMALRKHRLTSHTNLRPFKCSTCSKTFPMRYMVRDHERSHTGEKPFLCSLCGTSFSNRGHLYRHMRSHTLGTLHKRGRPRKYPAVNRPVLFKLKDAGQEVQEAFEELGGKEEAAGELGVVEIKTDSLQQDVVQEDLGAMGAGPTYITVHTIDGQLGDPTATQSIIGEGQLQHVVMETPDGMSDNMVLQVIRDLTGATTVYQHITEQPIASSSESVQTHSPQIIMSAMPEQPIASSSESVQSHPPQIIMSAMPQQGAGHQTLVVEPGMTNALDQPVVTGQQLIQSDGQQHQLIVAPSQTAVTQALPT